MPQAPNVYDAEPIPESARTAIEHLLTSGDLFRYTAPGATPVSLLETEFADWIGSKSALAVSSCSAALFLALKALGLPRGARVLVPAFTFAAVPSSVVHADCVPVFAEVDDSYRIDLDDFSARMDAGVDAVLVSHMRGHTSDMDSIMNLADDADVPVIEDAAHSLGTRWHGRTIGTIGRVGCFSFQSYKLVNAGEGGILVSDDDELIAKAVIMSGAYEHNWKKHPVLQDHFQCWQNRLPLYNMRMNNLSAAIIRSQIPEIPRRAQRGRENHDHVAGLLNRSPYFIVPEPLGPEIRAPDSIQFNLINMTDGQVMAFLDQTATKGVPVQVFGLSKDNARAFWNWQFLDPLPDLPGTRAMLMRACDVRLPARLSGDMCRHIARCLVESAARVVETPATDHDHR